MTEKSLNVVLYKLHASSNATEQFCFCRERMYILIEYFNYETVAYIATQTENGLGVRFF